MQKIVAKLPANRVGVQWPLTMFGVVVQKLTIVLAIAALSAIGAIGPVSAQDTDNYKVAQGLGVYLGVLPAAIVRGYAADRPEATMHGGAPPGRHEHHIVIAVFDTTTGDRVENAKVAITVSGVGHVGEHSLDLDPMTIAGTITYGAFVNFPGSDHYDIAVDVSVPGRNNPVHVDFTYDHVL